MLWGQGSVAWRWSRAPLQDYRGAVLLARQWQSQEGPLDLVAGGTGAELFEAYSDRPIAVVTTGMELNKRLERGPVIYLEAFADDSVASLKVLLEEASRREILTGLRYSVKIYLLPASKKK